MRYKYAINQAFSFDRKEVLMFLLSSFLSGFILSFRKWGTSGFNAGEGLYNLIIYTFFFLVLYFIFVAAQKYLAGLLGYYCKYTLWTFGPLIGVAITFMTYGFVPFLYLGSVHLRENPGMKLGKFRQAVNIKDIMWVGIVGPAAVIIATLLFIQPLFFITGAEVFRVAVVICIAIVFFSSLPLPNTNGINVILKTRVGWVVYFALGLILMALLWPLEFGAFIAAVILMAILLWLFSKLIEFHF